MDKSHFRIIKQTYTHAPTPYFNVLTRKIETITEKEDSFGIYEVFWTVEGELSFANDISMLPTAKTIDELRKLTLQFLEAFTHPVLEWDKDIKRMHVSTGEN